MKTNILRYGALWVLSAGLASAAYVDTGFDGYPAGTAFTSLLDGWRANTTGVVVTASQAYSASNSVVVPQAGSFSNAVELGAPPVVWTELRMRPVLGKAPALYPEATASFILYFDESGYAAILTGGVWRVCSNDVWGAAVTAVVENAWADIGIYQDFVRSNQALFVNGRLVVQDVAFVAPTPAYNRFVADGISSNTYLDDVRIQAMYDAARLPQDANGDGLADAAELHSYGYCGRTLYVGATQAFASVQAALDVARLRDTLSVAGETYAGDVTVSQNVRVVGAAFTNSGTLSVAAGATVSFAAPVEFSAASVTGTVALGSGGGLGLGSLTMAGSGLLDLTNGRLVVADAGVDMSGTFSIAGPQWGSDYVAPLPFHDDFELYGAGMRLQNARFMGWGASGTGAVVEAGTGVGAGRAAALVDAVVFSNRIASAAPAVWTEYYLTPCLGDASAHAPTGTSAFVSFVDVGGRLNVWGTNGWVVCSNDVMGGALVTLSTAAYARVDIHANYAMQQCAVFQDGQLLREQLAFPAASVTNYAHWVAEHNFADGVTRLDNVLVTTLVPGGLTNDIDGDGQADAVEVNTLGSIAARDYWGTQTLFRFK